MGEKTAVIPFQRIASVIHVIRGQKVMLDRDLAVLYGVETRALNQAVRRNSGRFPPDFMLELTRDEIRNISQSVISSATLKHAPKVFAFTEQGVAMLSGVLHSQQAVAVNVAIMRAFVRLREFLVSQAKLGKRLRQLEQRTEKHHESIQFLFEAIRQLTSERPSAIGFQYSGSGVSEARSMNTGGKIVNVQWDFDFRDGIFSATQGYQLCRKEKKGKGESGFEGDTTVEYAFEHVEPGSEVTIACRVHGDLGGEGMKAMKLKVE